MRPICHVSIYLERTSDPRPGAIRLGGGCRGARSEHPVSGRSGRFPTPIAVGRGYEGNSFQCPSETTSTVPSVTLMAVWSSIAYAGPEMPAAHCSASAMELPGIPS
jgi:hypothetical protein